MPKIKCKTDGCPHEIVYLSGDVTVILADAAGGKAPKDKSNTELEAKQLRKVILTLQCINGDINNYDVEL
jgi:hypothetical protein